MHHFTATVTNHKGTKLLWQQVRYVRNDSRKPTNSLPDQLNIADSIIIDSHEIVCILNDFFFFFFFVEDSIWLGLASIRASII